MKVNQRGESSGRQSSPVVLRTIILMAVGLSLLFSGAAQAQISFTNVNSGLWDGSDFLNEWAAGSIPPAGGSNDFTIVFTNTAPDLSTNNLGAFQLNQLIFAPPAQPVTLSGDSLQFNYSGSNATQPQVLQNSPSNMTINVDIALYATNVTAMTFAGTGSGGVTIGGSITGAVQLIKNGSYTLTLTNANSYSGGTVINNGAVAFATGAVPASSNITVNSSGSVWFQDGTIPTQLDKSSAGGLAVGTAAGSTNYNFSTSGLSNMALVAAQTMTNSYPLTPSGNVYGIGALAGTTFTYTNQLTGALSLNIGPGGGTVVLTNINNTFTGSTTIRDGTVLFIIADNNIGPGGTNLILSSGGTLRVPVSFTLNNRPVIVNPSGGGINVDATVTLTVTNPIGGPGVLTKSGAGDLSLTATNTVGGVMINAGRVILSTGIGLSNAVVTVNVDNGFTNTSSETAWVLGGLGGTNILQFLNGTNGPITRLTLGNNNNMSGNFSNTISGLVLTKVGNNTQILSASNRFIGATTATVTTNNGGGVLQYNSLLAIGDRSNRVNYSTMAAGYPIDQTFLTKVMPGSTTARSSTGVVALAVDSANSLDFQAAGAAVSNMSLGAVGNVTYSGLLTPYYTGPPGSSYPIYRLGGGGGTLTLGNTNALTGPGRTLIVSGNGTPAGTVVLTANNDFGLGTTVTNATLQLGSTVCVGAGTTTVNSGTLNVNAGASDGGVANPLVVVGSSFFNLLGASRAYNGAIIGSNNATLFVNIGPAGRTLSLYGPSMHDFYGTIDLGNSGGAIRLANNPGSTNATFNLGTNSANINVRNRNTTRYFGAISGAGTNTSVSGPSAGDQDGPTMFIVGGNNADATFAGNFYNGGPNLAALQFQKQGTGVWTLSGNSMLRTNYAFSGGILISNGTVVLAGPYSGSTNYGNAATPLNVWTVVPDNGLRFSNTTSAGIGALAGPGSISLLDVANVANGVTLTINSGPNLNTIYTGNLTGNCNSAIIKRGPGVLTLSGTNTYCGGTYIYGGIVGFGSDASFPPSGPLILSAGTCVGLFFTNVLGVLTNLSPSTAGGIAISSNSANEDIDFKTPGITNAWFVVGQNLTYGGTFTPLTNIVRLGANTGATFYYTNVISDAKYGTGTALYIGDFGGGTVALFPDPRIISKGRVIGGTNTCGVVVTNNVLVTNQWVIVTNDYTGGTFVSGNANAWSPLYITADANLGAPGSTLTLSNADLQVTNTVTLNNRPIVLRDASGIGVDPFSMLTVTNVISGTGPLTKYGAGVLVLGTNNSFTGGTMVNGGVVAYGNSNAVPKDSSVTVNSGSAVGFVFSNVQSVLSAVVVGNETNTGAVALFATNVNENISFSPTAPGANLWRMSLVAAENVTYGGIYTPYNLAFPGGSFYRLGAMAGTTLTYTNSIVDSNGASFVVIGGFSGGYGGTVVLAGNNTYTGGNGALNEGFGQTTIMGGTLSITNDNALGAGGDGNNLNVGGLMISNATLRTTNTITLDNRLVGLAGNATFNVQPGSILIITNSIRLSFTNYVTAVSLTKTDSGLLILTGTNNVPATSTKLDVYINGGVLRAEYGVGINFFPPTTTGVESNSNVQLNGGVWDVISQVILTNRVTAMQRSGGVSFQGGRSGLSARDYPLVVWFGTDAVATSNAVPDSTNVSTQKWAAGTGTPFDASTFVLNEYTANKNLTWMTHLDLNSGLFGVTTRTIDVSATNTITDPLVTTIFGTIMNTTSTNNTPGPYPALDSTNGVGGLTKTGIGTLVLDGTNSYNGATTINRGTLKLGNDLGCVGSIYNSRFIVVGNSTNGATFDVSAVAPYTIGGNTNQALAGGPGTIIGDVILTNMDTFAPGDTASSTNYLICRCEWCGTNAVTNAVAYLTSRVGTLTFSNNLTVASTFIYDLGTNSDLAVVASNLTVGGTLNIRAASGFTSNVMYTLFTYGGTLTTNGSPGVMTIGTVPDAGLTYAVDISSNGLVRLNVTGGGAPPCTPPGASFTASPTNGAPNLQVIFTDTSTGTITSVTWTFGDGNSVTNAAATTVTNTYTTAGHYSVTQIVDSTSCGISTNGQPNLIWVYTAWEAWQQQYFACIGCAQAAGNLDADGDGISNTNEFLAGTNPTNSLSGLRIISVVRQATTNMVITWNAVGGKYYVVQTNAPPASGSYTNNFADLSSSIGPIPGSGDTTAVYTNWAGATNAPSRYYRIRLVP